ncbi:MAG: DUF998 domain-containing protein [Lysobacter sp.]
MKRSSTAAGANAPGPAANSIAAPPVRDRAEPVIAMVAALCCLAALLGFGAALDGYSHWRHPPGLLGARGIEHAFAFNLLAYIGPGLALAWIAWRLGAAMQAQGARARIGAWLWLWSALAWAAQGVLRLDPQDLDAAASRLHALAWLLWWLAFAPGALLLGWAGLRAPQWRRFGAVALIAAGVLTLAIVAADLRLAPSAPAQRLALLAWLVAYVAAVWPRGVAAS